MSDNAMVLREQVESLRAALQAVLDARDVEAKAAMSYQNARENFSDDNYERKAHTRAMIAASEAESSARLLLATLKKVPRAELAQRGEPVAWMMTNIQSGDVELVWNYDGFSRALWAVTPLYAAPPQRKPLSEERILELSERHQHLQTMAEFVALVNDIERELGIGD